MCTKRRKKERRETGIDEREAALAMRCSMYGMIILR